LTHFRQIVDDAFELGTFSSQGLGALGIIPDFGVFEFPKNFGQAFLLGFEVKDTP
jgi:hypothetical protein